MMEYEMWRCGACAGFVAKDGYVVRAFGHDCEGCIEGCPMATGEPAGCFLTSGWEDAEQLIEEYCSVA